ncbi:MAG TPA: tricarballylate utilization 4Fe-4S protein TcuB [Aliidongia sp.]|nr:tricarballylate utilization 4Fe-4S protein TcuB [Aliidongia sp.]
MHATEALAEADRLMTVCNSCRYCEGVCAVFPAMETRRAFLDGDLNYLANLCHSCGACFYDCQFSPPHEFNVNVPKVMATVRAESYAAYAWPGALAFLFKRNAAAITIITLLSMLGFVAGFGDHLGAVETGPGAFYRLMPHDAMALLFGAAFLFALLALGMSLGRFWRDIGEPAATLGEPAALGHALRDAGELRYLGGGGAGCMNEDERPSRKRRLYHHFTFYGFLLCFAATSVATLYHYLLGREAPYAWYDLPVLLGTLGGIGLLVGPIGLLAANLARDPATRDTDRRGMDLIFLAMLIVTAGTGLGLLALRDTGAMGTLLALHLGAVFALFITMPYGKFVHGLYRFAALVRYAKERRTLAGH